MSSANVFNSVLIWLLTFQLLFPAEVTAQTLGGRAAYNFVRLPSSPLLAALGGVNVSYKTDEIGLTANNPALLDSSISRQLNASFHGLMAGTKAYSLTGAWQVDALKTTFSGHIFFLDHGTLPNTDAAGNVMGQFRPLEYVVQASAARPYLENWTLGATLKFIYSSYGLFRSSALAADIGVHYLDSSHQVSASLLIKNMGAQLRTYAGEAEELPFDLQAGITKRLAKAPFGFSLTAQHLQTFNLLYNDTTFNRDTNFSSSTSAFAKLLTHLVLATHLYVGPNIEASLGYNFLRRRELSTGTEGNGLTGFSGGLRVRFSKLQVQYARSAYQRGVAANQIGLTLHLDRLFGLGF